MHNKWVSESQSIRARTFFENQHIEIHRIIQLVYLFLFKVSAEHTSQMISANIVTIYTFFKEFRIVISTNVHISAIESLWSKARIYILSRKEQKISHYTFSNFYGKKQQK